jgi:hypothetical protein
MKHIVNQTAQNSPHPFSLINLDAARRRFGEQKVDLLITLTQTIDPLADALIQELEQSGMQGARQLNLGIRQGLQAIDSPPPALHAFLTEVEHIPGWVNRERVERGAEAYLSLGAVWTTLALGPGSLTHTYGSPAIAKVLVRTGNLTNMALRRLTETGIWNIEAHMPGALVRGANGYIHTIQVRLLHARVRQTLLKRGWDQSATGLPINQLDMIRTWLDFTYVPLNALSNFGITLTRQQLDDLYHNWQYIAYLLGIDEHCYRSITDQGSAKVWLDLISSTEEPPNEDSRALEDAMLVAIAQVLGDLLKLSPSLSFDLASAVTRRMHGDKLANKLGIKKTWVSAVLPLLVLFNRVQQVWSHRSAASRQRALTRAIASFEGFIKSNTTPTTYQSNALHPDQQQLPKTTQ